MPQKKSLTISEIPEEYDGVFSAKMSNTSVASAEVSGAGATRNVDITPSATNATKGDYNVSINATATTKYNPITPTKKVPVIFYAGFKPALESSITNIEVSATATDDRFIIGTILNLPSDYSGDITLQSDNDNIFTDLTVSRLGNNFIIYGTKITSTIKGSTNITITIPNDDNGNRNIGDKQLHLEVRSVQYLSPAITQAGNKLVVNYDSQITPSFIYLSGNNQFSYRINKNTSEEMLDIVEELTITNTKNNEIVYQGNAQNEKINKGFNIKFNNTTTYYNYIYITIDDFDTYANTYIKNTFGKYEVKIKLKGDNYNIIQDTSEKKLDDFYIKYHMDADFYGAYPQGFPFPIIQEVPNFHAKYNAETTETVSCYFKIATNWIDFVLPETYKNYNQTLNTNNFDAQAKIAYKSIDETPTNGYIRINYDLTFTITNSSYGDKLESYSQVEMPNIDEIYFDTVKLITNLLLDLTISYSPSSFTFSSSSYSTNQSITIAGLNSYYLPYSTIIKENNSNIQVSYTNQSSTSRTIQIHPTNSSKGSYSSSITLIQEDIGNRIRIENPIINFSYKTTSTFTPTMSTNAISWNVSSSTAAKTVSITGLPSDYTGSISVSNSYSSYIASTLSGSGTSRTITITPNSAMTPGLYYVYVTIPSDSLNICSNTAQRSIPIYIQKNFTPSFSVSSISTYNTDTAAKTLTISEINSSYTGSITISGKSSSQTVSVSGSGASRTVSVSTTSSATPGAYSFVINFSTPSYGWVSTVTSKTISVGHYYYFTASFSTTAVRLAASTTQTTHNYTLSNIPSGYTGSITASISSTTNSSKVAISGSGTSRTISYTNPSSSSASSRYIIVNVPSSGYYLSRTTSFKKYFYNYTNITAYNNSTLSTINNTSNRISIASGKTGNTAIYINATYATSNYLKDSGIINMSTSNSSIKLKSIQSIYKSSDNKYGYFVVYFTWSGTVARGTNFSVTGSTLSNYVATNIYNLPTLYFKVT